MDLLDSEILSKSLDIICTPTLKRNSNYHLLKCNLKNLQERILTYNALIIPSSNVCSLYLNLKRPNHNALSTTNTFVNHFQLLRNKIL